MKVGQDNLHFPSQPQTAAKQWAVKVIEPFFTFLFLNYPSLPPKFCQLVSNLVAILRRQSQTMEKEWTRDLNIDNQAGLKKKHNCDQCNYSTAVLSNLKRHKLVHSGEKPFACSQCKYSCTQACDLKSHLLIHSGENPFKCRQCNYSCKQASDLKKHMLTHSGEKAFNCA